MSVRTSVCAALFLATSAVHASAEERVNHYRFSSNKYNVEMRVVFQKTYSGARLVVYGGADPTREICLSVAGANAGCTERFVGAVALVRYTIERSGRTAPKNETLRERVRIIGRSPGVPDRPDFARSERVVNGVASDVQAFGYDESDIRRSDRLAVRKESAKHWIVFRQELYLGNDKQPFAVLDWKHTIAGITLQRAQSGPEAAPI